MGYSVIHSDERKTIMSGGFYQGEGTEIILMGDFKLLPKGCTQATFTFPNEEQAVAWAKNIAVAEMPTKPVEQEELCADSASGGH